MLRTHKIGEVNEKLVGKKVKLTGWVDTIREHGNVIFIDLRDKYGKIQTVISKKGAGEDEFAKAKKLTAESCIGIEGEIKASPKGAENKDLVTGKVEMSISGLEVYNGCKMLPMKMHDPLTNEDIRLKNKYEELETIFNLVEQSKGTIHIITHKNEPGLKLQGISGIAALLRF